MVLIADDHDRQNREFMASGFTHSLIYLKLDNANRFEGMLSRHSHFSLLVISVITKLILDNPSLVTRRRI